MSMSAPAIGVGAYPVSYAANWWSRTVAP